MVRQLSMASWAVGKNEWDLDHKRSNMGTLWPLPLTDWFEGAYWLLEVTGRIERVRMMQDLWGALKKLRDAVFWMLLLISFLWNS